MSSTESEAPSPLGTPHGCPHAAPRSTFLHMTNYDSGRTLTSRTDALEAKARSASARPTCEAAAGVCAQAMMTRPDLSVTPERQRTPALVSAEAAEFLQQMGTELRLPLPDVQARVEAVHREIAETGTWELTTGELVFGVKLAWRNSARCIGRLVWDTLQVRDKRSCTTAEQVFQECLEHMRISQNNGNIVPCCTLFAKGVRVWNPQLVRYAGYRQPDGSVLGDPAHVEFTAVCERLGWRGKRTMFDILPWIIEMPGQEPRMFPIPEGTCIEVHFTHPKYPALKSLGLRWHALPAISGMGVEIGGVYFSALPFSGWYMQTEIGCRNFIDKGRYDMLVPLAKAFDVDTTLPLWKDRVVIEFNIAVLHSFQQAKCNVVDHYSASEQFLTFYNREMDLRGVCPADWTWLVPPMSGALCPVFHQEMVNFTIRPNFVYQPERWRTYHWPSDRNKKLKFKRIAFAIVCFLKLMLKAVAGRTRLLIAYGTETGTAARMAKMAADLYIQQLFMHVTVVDLATLTLAQLAEHKRILFIVSTYGDGQPPTSVIPLWREICANSDLTIFSKTSYAVLGLGSRQYETFCQFAKELHDELPRHGATPFMAYGTACALQRQRETALGYLDELAMLLVPTKLQHSKGLAARTAGLASEVSSAGGMRRSGSVLEVRQRDTEFKLRYISDDDAVNMTRQRTGSSPVLLAWDRDKDISGVRIVTRDFCGRDKRFMRLVLQTDGTPLDAYLPGDHVGIMPENQPDVVSAVAFNLKGAPALDQLLVAVDPAAPQQWTQPISVRDVLLKRIDLAGPPQMSFFEAAARVAGAPAEAKRLHALGTDSQQYMAFVTEERPSVLHCFSLFPSLVGKMGLEMLLTHGPRMQPRLYSIASARDPQRPNGMTLLLSLPESSHGLCTNYLNSPATGTVQAFLRHNKSFRPPPRMTPADCEVPVIMVAAGSGLAPFLSFVDAWQQQCEAPIPNVHLFYGCRTSYEYDSITARFENSMTALDYADVHLAISRPISRTPRAYVQELLLFYSVSVRALIVEQGAHVFVCGSVPMARGVKSVLNDIIGHQEGSVNGDDGIARLISEGRYHEDVFQSHVGEMRPIRHSEFSPSPSLTTGLRGALQASPVRVDSSSPLALAQSSRAAAYAMQERATPNLHSVSLPALTPVIDAAQLARRQAGSTPVLATGYLNLTPPYSAAPYAPPVPTSSPAVPAGAPSSVVGIAPRPSPKQRSIASTAQTVTTTQPNGAPRRGMSFDMDTKVTHLLPNTVLAPPASAPLQTITPAMGAALRRMPSAHEFDSKGRLTSPTQSPTLPALKTDLRSQ